MGLNTVAIYDEKADEFIIHSPDITAAKWWIGGLGVASTHAVVQAQLMISGKSYGPHLPRPMVVLLLWITALLFLTMFVFLVITC
jgi:hypothetical protein